MCEEIGVSFLTRWESKYHKVYQPYASYTKNISRYVLDKILKSAAKDEVVDSIHGYLRSMADDIRQGKVALKKFAITKV